MNSNASSLQRTAAAKLLATTALMKACAVLCLAFLAGWPLASPAQSTHTLPLVRAVDFAGQESLVRIVNRSDSAGSVRITATDDTGERFGPVTLKLGVRQAVNITSGDLERGNAEKGLPAGVGDGSGSWRLELETALAIEPLAYIRTPDGFLTAMHDVAPVSGESHWVPFFNPAPATRKVSHLRLINPGTAPAEVTVAGRDDGGDEASGTVRLTLPAGAARTLTAQALEAGGEGFDGRLGDGAGKWRLNVSSTAEIQVMSLLASPTGHLANLSTAPSNAGGDGGDDDHGDTRGTATVVGAPSTTSGRLETRGDVDYFRFELPSAGQLRVQATGSTDTVGRLFQGTTLRGTDDDSGTEGNFRITLTEAQAGTWYVEVRGHREATGPYTLQVEFEPSNDPPNPPDPPDPPIRDEDDYGDTRGTAYVVEAPSTTSGNLETGGDVDYFRFELPSAGRLTVRSETGTPPSGTRDTVGRLFRGNTLVERDDDSAVGNHFRIEVPEAQAGTWYVEVSAHRNMNVNSGFYKLQVEFESSDGPPDPPPDPPVEDDDEDDRGDTRATASVVRALPYTGSGRLETRGDIDYFRVSSSTLRSAGSLWVQTTGSTNTTGRLFQGPALRGADDDAGPGTNFRITWSEVQGGGLSELSGDWYVEVRGYNNETTGPYTLQITTGARRCGWAAGHVLNRESPAAARRDAVNRCRENMIALFGDHGAPWRCSAPVAFNHCMAVASSDDECNRSYGNDERSREAAEQSALHVCNHAPHGRWRGNEPCRIAVTAEGTRLSFCNTGSSRSYGAIAVAHTAFRAPQ